MFTVYPSSPSFSLPLTFRSQRRRPSTTVASALSDPYVLTIAEILEDCIPSPPSLQPLRNASSQSLLTKRWPTRKDEPFRFTDLSILKQSLPLPVPAPSLDFTPDSPLPHLLCFVDGHFLPSKSRLDVLPSSVFAGSVEDIPKGVAFDRVSEAMEGFGDGDLFWDLNGVGAPDLVVVFVPEGVRVEGGVHFKFCYSASGEVGSEKLPLSCPRVLVVVEKGAEITIVEEHVGVEESEGRCYWANSAIQLVIGEEGKVLHSYLQSQSTNAAHIKWTFVQQEASSTYELTEISTGGKLSRHNLHIQQTGPDTITEHSAFHMSQSNQTQDLHSKLILDHPRGYSRQLHKCIVTHSSGNAVFDGNIRVNRFAQQTDAGQLTRSLLMRPRATVNVKPNLQIVADDVKCSHGAAISDLEEDQLFYFQARGIDLKTARDALVFSFGAEVISRLPLEPIRKNVTNQLKTLLASQQLNALE